MNIWVYEALSKMGVSRSHIQLFHKSMNMMVNFLYFPELTLCCCSQISTEWALERNRRD